MFGITVSEAAAICGGSVYGDNSRDAEISRLVIDSRDIKPGDMFAAYKGEKSDGHDYILSSLEKGAVCALAEHLPSVTTLSAEARDSDSDVPLLPGPVIICRNVQEAVENIAAAFRRKVDIPVIGVTGSVGKTTAKEMISSVLSQHFKVHKTSGNLNNTIGLPVSLCGIQRDDECAVLEMGINHFGEMTRLGRMASPDIAVFTVIGHAHLEFLGDLNGVLKAKTEMLEYMSDDALLIMNGDDSLLRSFNCVQWKLTFGKSDSCEVFADNIDTLYDGHLTCDIHYSGRTVHAVIPVFGDHMIYAALEGAAVGFAMGLSDDEIEKGIASYTTVGRRFSVQDTGYIRLIDDCYNANPDSVRSSISSLASLSGRKICILGDMLELGEKSPDMHREIGEFARDKGIDVFLGCGRLGSLASDAFNECSYAEDKCDTGSILSAFSGLGFKDKASLIKALPSLIHEGDTVLVKASLGSHLEDVSEALKKLSEEKRT